MRKILVVDDNRDYTEVLAEILLSSGHSVAIAHEPTAALISAIQFRPDVCLLDIGLPEMDGYELAEKIRACVPDVTIIGISGGTREPEREKRAGAVLQEFIVKPFTWDVLESALARIGAPR